MAETYVIVAFRTDRVNSIYYRKCNTIQELQKHLKRAFDKGAHFISIRRIQQDEGRVIVI